MTKPNATLDELYTVPETAKLLGIDRRTLRRWTLAGSIRSHIRKCDGRIVYTGADIIKCYSTII